MRYLSVSLAFFMLSFFALGQNLVPFQDDYELSWNNFKAQPDESSSYHAITKWQIKYDCSVKNNVATFDVVCSFNEDNSWVKSDKKTDKLLQHERVHFLLAEVCTRRLRKSISEANLSFSVLQTEVNNRYEREYNECVLMQEEYDAQTEHSINQQKQEEWNVKINEELNKLNSFKKTTFEVSLQPEVKN